MQMVDESKQINKTKEIQNNSNSMDISGVDIFKNRPHLVYLYKKTEKLVSALYMLSNFISDKEPIKWQLREIGTELLSQSLALSNKTSFEQMPVFKNFVVAGLKTLSFLNISYLSGIVSEMNYLILKHEFEALIRTIESGEEFGNNKGLIFSDHFFEISEEYQGNKLEELPSQL